MTRISTPCAPSPLAPQTANPTRHGELAAPGISRRTLIAAGGLALGGGALVPALAANETGPIRVALISPTTGVLSSFGISNTYVHGLLAPRLAAGLDTVNLGKRVVKLELYDAASSSEQAASLATRLVADGVHMLIASGTPEMCNPVSDVCEAAGVPCVTTVAPWQGWLFGRKSTPSTGFRWTYHFFSGVEDFADVYTSLFKRAGLGSAVGGLWGDDIDATAFLSAFPQAMAKQSLTLFDAGRVKLAAPDFAPVVRKLMDANVQMVTGNLPPPVALEFFATARRLGYKPRMASIAKAFAFPDTVTQVNQPGVALTNEVWWSPAWPFKSALTGETAPQLCNDFEAATKTPWLQTLGFSHALIDVVAEAVRQAKAPTREGLRDAVARLQVSTVAGVINFKSRHPSLNVCTTPAVGGQWQRQANGRWTLQVVDNTRSPFIPVTSQLTL